MSAHTPGPWMVGGPFPGVSVCHETDAGDWETPPTWEPICIIDHSTKGPQNPQALADARLIAESPTLLALLKECLANSPGRTSDWRARVEKSIARAEGRQP